MTDPLGFQTIYGYDSDGNNVTVKDPMGRDHDHGLRRT